MKKLMGIPGEEGYSMPGEFEPHRGCIMIWPKRPGSWNYGAKKAREAFKRVAWAIAESEEVFMLAEPDVEENAREMLAGNPAPSPSKKRMIALIVVVLPVPGPPVRIKSP